MKKFGLLSTSAIGSAALFGLSLAFAAPASAQGTAQPADDEAAALPDQAANAQEDDGQVVQVTGSRIRRPNLESTVPITSITGDQILPAGRHQYR